MVRIVDSDKLDSEKVNFQKISSQHVYSVQPKQIGATRNLHEIDFRQSCDLVSSGQVLQLGELNRVNLTLPAVVGRAPDREKAHAPSPKAQVKEEPESKPSSNTVFNSNKQKSPKSAEGKKRNVQMIEDSDDDDPGQKQASPQEKKFKTYINDSGEEVTGKDDALKEVRAL